MLEQTTSSGFLSRWTSAISRTTYNALSRVMDMTKPIAAFTFVIQLQKVSAEYVYTCFTLPDGILGTFPNVLDCARTQQNLTAITEALTACGAVFGADNCFEYGATMGFGTSTFGFATCVWTRRFLDGVKDQCTITALTNTVENGFGTIPDILFTTALSVLAATAVVGGTIYVVRRNSRSGEKEPLVRHPATAAEQSIDGEQQGGSDYQHVASARPSVADV